MRAKIQFTYSSGTITRDRLEALAKICGANPPEALCRYAHSSDNKEVEVDKDGKYKLYTGNTWEVDLEALLEFGVPFEVQGKGESNVFSALLDELRGIGRKVDTFGYKDAQFNEKVSVHVPGFALMLIDHVKVLNNDCTDDLQTWLDKGWRILAICPQPDQRRPDYVIGRTGEES
jgi:hypothetical protein